jgi:hypothetical protein
VGKGNTGLRDVINKTQAALPADATLSMLIKRWRRADATLPP